MSAELSQEQMCELESQLRALQHELTEQLERSKPSPEPESGNGEDAHRSAAEIRLRLIAAALTSLKLDEDGFCQECEEPIGYERLKAKPESRYCDNCQHAREARRP